ncbi:hypothetical protein Tco_1047510 [Tanacetum coccineum]
MTALTPHQSSTDSALADHTTSWKFILKYLVTSKRHGMDINDGARNQVVIAGPGGVRANSLQGSALVAARACGCIWCRLCLDGIVDAILAVELRLIESQYQVRGTILL